MDERTRVSSARVRAMVTGLVVVAGCGEPAPSSSAGDSPVAVEEVQASSDVPAAAPPKEREPVERPQTPEQFVGKHVLVAAGTPLFVAAKAGAATVKLRMPEGGRAGARAFAVVRHENGFLKLTRAQPDARCDDGLPELDAFDPTLFVEPAHVAAVLARETTAQFPDGTSVGLRPGAAVEQEGPNGLVDAGGVRLSVAIDPRDVGTAFTPTMAKPPTEAPARIAAGSKLRYGDGKELVVGEALFTDMRGGFVVSKTDDGADVLVEVLNGCVTVRARTDAASLGETYAMARHAGVLGMMGSSGFAAEYIVAAGAPVSWSDGTPAGKLAAEQRFPLGKRGKSKKGKSCFAFAETDARIEPVEICVAAKHVKKHDPMAILYGTGLSGGFGAEDYAGVLGGVDGSMIGDAYGTGGLGTIGIGGRGGGGIGEGGGGSGQIGGLEAVPSSRVRVTARGIETEGALAPAKLKSKIGAIVNGVEYCAESASPKATGTLSITVAIGEDGKPTKVGVSGIAAIESCVQRTIERWSLPKSAGSTTAQFDLVLEES